MKFTIGNWTVEITKQRKFGHLPTRNQARRALANYFDELAVSEMLDRKELEELELNLKVLRCKYAWRHLGKTKGTLRLAKEWVEYAYANNGCGDPL